MNLSLKYKNHIFMLIKPDYEQIKSTKYFEDFLKYLEPVKNKFFFDVLKAGNLFKFVKLQNKISI